MGGEWVEAWRNRRKDVEDDVYGCLEHGVQMSMSGKFIDSRNHKGLHSVMDWTACDVMFFYNKTETQNLKVIQALIIINISCFCEKLRADVLQNICNIISSHRQSWHPKQRTPQERPVTTYQP